MDNFGNRPNLTYIPTLKLVPTLPAVYGDELSYYEAIAHMQSALNQNTEQLANAFEQVYQMLVDGIGSGVAISYTDATEDIMFVVSSDIKPEEPITQESLTIAVAKNTADIANNTANISATNTAVSGLQASLSAESTTRSEADSDLSERITAEANTREEADTALQNQIDEVAPVVYTDETNDIEWGEHNG